MTFVRRFNLVGITVGLADTVTFVAMPDDSRAEIMRMAAEVRAIRDVELSRFTCHWSATPSPRS